MFLECSSQILQSVNKRPGLVFNQDGVQRGCFQAFEVVPDVRTPARVTDVSQFKKKIHARYNIEDRDHRCGHLPGLKRFIQDRYICSMMRWMPASRPFNLGLDLISYGVFGYWCPT